MADEARSEDDLFGLVRKGQVLSVREMLTVRPGLVNQQDRLGWTALHYAAMLGNLKLAEVLVEFGADVNLQNDDGYTPLHWAVLNHHEKLCVLLYDKGADPEVPDKFGERPMELSPAKLRKLFQSPSLTPPSSPSAHRTVGRPRSTSTTSVPSFRARSDGIMRPRSPMSFSPQDDMAIPSRSSTPPRRSLAEELAAAAEEKERNTGTKLPWYHWRSLYDLGKKPAIMKIIQILFQVILCLLLEMLQEQAKRFVQLAVILAPGQLYFIVMPITWILQIFRPLWMNLIDPVIRPLISLLFAPLRLVFGFLLATLGATFLSIFQFLFQPILTAIGSTLWAVVSPFWTYLFTPIYMVLKEIVLLPLRALASLFSSHWASFSRLLVAQIRANLMPKQLLYNVFYPLVKGIRILLLKYIDWFPLPVTLITSRLAHLIFGVASAEETAMIIILSFTLCAYASVLLLGYTFKLAAFLTARLVTFLSDAESAATYIPPSLYISLKPDFDHHQLGALVLLLILSAFALFELFRLGALLCRASARAVSFIRHKRVAAHSPVHPHTPPVFIRTLPPELKLE